jgi:hypothetical protein
MERYAGPVPRVGNEIYAYKILIGKPDEKKHLEFPGIDMRIILK